MSQQLPTLPGGAPAPIPAGGAEGQGLISPNNPFAKTPEELSALEDFTPEGWTGELEADKKNMLKHFHQTQQALQQHIRTYEAANAQIAELQRKAGERDAMVQIPGVHQAVTRHVYGTEDGPGQNGGQPQPAATSADDGIDFLQMEPAEAKRKIEAMIQEKAQAIATAQVQEVLTKNVMPVVQGLVTREGSRTEAETQAVFGRLGGHFADFKQLEGQIDAAMKQFPGMDAEGAYRYVGGTGQTHEDVRRAQLTPGSGHDPILQSEPNKPGDWNAAAKTAVEALSGMGPANMAAMRPGPGVY